MKRFLTEYLLKLLWLTLEEKLGVFRKFTSKQEHKRAVRPASQPNLLQM